ncbi:MAG TPA: hypothetical protein VFZ61_03750 [Polyangiales bacterium]
MKGAWRPPNQRPGLLKRVVAMFRLSKRGKHREARRLYQQLPTETRGVLALLAYVECFGDLYARPRRKWPPKPTRADVEAMLFPAAWSFEVPAEASALFFGVPRCTCGWLPRPHSPSHPFFKLEEDV